MREEAQYQDVAGDAAIDGTGSHELLELCLNNNVAADQYLDQIVAVNHEDSPMGWLVKPDRISRVNEGLNYVKRRVAELKEQFPGCEVAVEAESRSDPGKAFGRDDWNGTCDITLIAHTKGETGYSIIHFVETIDYKDGRGYVGEKMNTQLLSYNFGKLLPYITQPSKPEGPFHHEWVEGCRMTIIQPKTNPSVRYWCSTVEGSELDIMRVIHEAHVLAQAADQTDDDDAPCNPGKHCQWCKANPKRGGHCTADADQTVNNMSIDVNDNSLFDRLKAIVADPKRATADELADLSDLQDALAPLFKVVRDEVTNRVSELGESVPGFAMGAGKNERKWSKSDEDMVKILKEKRLKGTQIYPQTLVTPPALEKMKGLSAAKKKSIMEEYCVTKSGKSTLVRVERGSTDVDTESTDDVKSADKLFGGVAAPGVPAPPSKPQLSFA